MLFFILNDFYQAFYPNNTVIGFKIIVFRGGSLFVFFFRLFILFP